MTTLFILENFFSLLANLTRDDNSALEKGNLLSDNSKTVKFTPDSQTLHIMRPCGFAFYH